MIEMDYIYDTLFIENLYNKTLPDWTKSVFPDKMKYLRDLSFTITTWNDELKRLTAGPLIDNIIKTFQSVADGDYVPKDRKMIMYSAHDTTLAYLLNSLGLFDPPLAPPYASLVMFELYNDNTIKIFYRNDTTRDPYELTLNGCNSKCTVQKMDHLTSGLRPSDWKSDCAMMDNDPVIAFVTKVSLFVCICLVVILVGAVIVSLRRSRAQQDMVQYQAVNQNP